MRMGRPCGGDAEIVKAHGSEGMVRTWAGDEGDWKGEARTGWGKDALRVRADRGQGVQDWGVLRDGMQGLRGEARTWGRVRDKIRNGYINRAVWGSLML